jgi:Ser/Thr protein kinase RdoA (MazF antagonist)
MTEPRPTLETAATAARQFGAGPGEPQLVNAGVNTVYRLGGVALRLASAAQKNRDYLTPPLDWLRHLHAAGAGVCEPLPTLSGDWISSVTQGPDTFLATAVRWVEGPRLSDLRPTPALYREYGRSIGRLHRAARGYAPSPTAPPMLGPAENGVFPRWEWLWQRAAAHVTGFPVLERAFDRLTPAVLAWSAEETVMTHGDLRPGNVIWQGNAGAVIIDFDEPVLGPAALDLARAALELNAAERPRRLATLLEGYRLEHELKTVWEDRIAPLMAARAALMAAWSVQEGQVLSGAGSGAVVSVPRLLTRLEHWDF